MKFVITRILSLSILILLLSASSSFAIKKDEDFLKLQRQVDQLAVKTHFLRSDHNSLQNKQDGLATKLGEIENKIDSSTKQLEENQQTLSALGARLTRLQEEINSNRQTMGNELREQGYVGEIRYSILSIKQFQTLYGDNWVLLNGIELDPSDDLRSQFGWEKLPDARGLFFRCANDKREKGGNPDGDVEIGTEQCDATAVNQLKVDDPGHSHPVEHLWSGNSPGKNQHWTVAGCPEQRTGQYSVTASLNKTGITLKSDSEETRPRCITVNAFIKIRNEGFNRFDETQKDKNQKDIRSYFQKRSSK